MTLQEIAKWVKWVPGKMLLVGPYIVRHLGIFLNDTATTFNSGMMPVWYDPKYFPNGCPVRAMAEDPLHVCLDGYSHLRWLSDIITTRYSISSPGDMLIYAGDLVLFPCFLIWAYLVYRKVKNG
jgi:hypothetical protein